METDNNRLYYILADYNFDNQLYYLKSQLSFIYLAGGNLLDVCLLFSVVKP